MQNLLALVKIQSLNYTFVQDTKTKVIPLLDIKSNSVINLCGRIFYIACTRWKDCNIEKKKGKNIAIKKNLCINFLWILQDPMIGNGQKLTTFWEKVHFHYNANWPQACVKKPIRSLETKWGIIKHNVAKFCGNYNVVSVLCASRTSNENTLKKSLELYRIQHLHHQSFTFFHC